MNKIRCYCIKEKPGRKKKQKKEKKAKSNAPRRCDYSG